MRSVVFVAGETPLTGPGLVLGPVGGVSPATKTTDRIFAYGSDGIDLTQNANTPLSRFASWLERARDQVDNADQ